MTEAKGQARRYLVVINRGSGTVLSMGEDAVRRSVEEGLQGAGEVEIRLLEGAEITPAIEAAVKTGSHDIIVAGGGDGSVGAAAAILAGSGLALAVLPLGTMNMMARTVGFSTILGEAVRQIAEGEIDAIDIGRVNGRVFLHQVSFGLQPRVIRIREKLGYSSRLTKMLGGLAALLAVLSRPRMLRLAGEIDGKPVALKLPALAVSNNLYRDDRPSMAQRLDGGVLGVYMVTAAHWTDYLRLAIAVARRNWRADVAVEAHAAQSVRIETGRRSSRRRAGRTKLLASVDGELVYLESPALISIEPKALRLVVPARPLQA